MKSLTLWLDDFSTRVNILSNDWFMWLTESVYAAAGETALLLAGVVLLVNLLCRRWLTARQMCLLWSLVLVRLLVPWVPASPVSLSQWMYGLFEAEEASVTVQNATSAVPAATSQSPPRPSAHPSTPPVEPPASFIDLVFNLVIFFWIFGLVAVPLSALLLHSTFLLQVRRFAQPADERLRRLWQGCCERVGFHRAIAIQVFDGVQQPAVMGLFRWRLLLPRDVAQLNDEQLEMIMLHELAHLRRRDIVANWLLLVVRTLHWWNPVYWLAASRYLSLREQACDEFVLRTISQERRRGYGELLLQLAARSSPRHVWRVMLPVALLGIIPDAFRTRGLRNRLRAIGRPRHPQGRLHLALAALAISVVAISGLTTAHEPPPIFDSTTRSINALISAESDDSQPLLVEVYSVEDTIERIGGDLRAERSLAMGTLLECIRQFLPRRKSSIVHNAATGEDAERFLSGPAEMSTRRVVAFAGSFGAAGRHGQT